MRKKQGFTLIELLAVIVILAIIALIATPLIINVIDETKKGSFKNTAYGIVNAAELGYTQDVLNGTAEEIIYSYTDGVESSTPSGKVLNYKGAKPKNGTVIINTEGKVAIALHDGNICATKGYDESKVKIADKPMGECVIPSGTSVPNYIYYNQLKGINAPIISNGMTPIKWNGTSWEETTEDDPEWYDYDNKKWANVKTTDGSFWVWIPRFAYQIANNYHTSTTGTINIKFLIDTTNTTSDEVTIDKIPVYSGNSQINYINHPAFSFGADEIPGIWVAKFEPSVADQTDSCYINANETNCDKTTLIPKIIPNASSWRYISVGNAFDVSLEMKNNTSTYGWDNSEVDTHVMTNTEWGAIAYLSHSQYGKNDNIWINPANDYTTGCAATTFDSIATTGCTNTYETNNGQEASTTGNTYGIYDMSGGAYERVCGYLDNDDANLLVNASSIINAEHKYKNLYSIDVNDARVDNYNVNSSFFGDAVYETSVDGIGSATWYQQQSYMPYTSYGWFLRGGYYNGKASSGLFGFNSGHGNPSSYFSFRPVVIPAQ